MNTLQLNHELNYQNHVDTGGWALDTARYLMGKGYRVIPHGEKSPLVRFANGEICSLEHSAWANAKSVSVVLDDAILLDYDGNKGEVISTSELAEVLGIPLETLNESLVQSNNEGDSLHFLFKREISLDGLKQSNDGWMRHIDVKTGNQLMTIKRHKKLSIPHKDQLKVAPLKLINSLKLAPLLNEDLTQTYSTSCLSDWIGGIKDGESLHSNSLRMIGSLISRGLNEQVVIEIVQLMLRGSDDGSERYKERINDVPRLVRNAIDKGFGAPTQEVVLNSSSMEDIDPVKRLRNFSLNGCSEDLRKQMLDQKFVLEDVAILDQWTTIYASPNTGKTLLTLWMLYESLAGGQINGDEVFYVNADDTFRGVVEKTELAEQWGFHMITPNQNGFTSRIIIDLMVEMAERHSAKGIVIVLDTLKKFTDLMHKKEASEFGAIARGFVSAGGTLIVLAHVNKHRAADGKPVYAGTSDIRDDSDCVFIMDLIDGERYQGVMTVEMMADKVRGDVADRVCLQYNSIRGQDYVDLIGSVKRIDRDYLDSVKAQRLVEEKLADDQPVIDAIIRHIDAGIKSKSKLVSAVNADTGVSHAKIREVLFERTGGVFDLGHRWCVQIGAHNKQDYAVLLKQ